MRRLYYLLAAMLALASLLSLATLSEAGWGKGGCSGGQCAAVAAPAQVQAPRPFNGWARRPEWRQAMLYRNGLLVGGYDYARGIYRTYENGRWSEPTSPPWEEDPSPCSDGCTCCECENGCACGRGKPCGPGCPCVTGKQVIEQNEQWVTSGVDADKIGRTERYTISGKPASKREVLQALAEGLPDDAAKLRLTVIGADEQQRNRVIDDLARDAKLAKFRDGVIVKSFSPDHWQVKRMNFVTSGKPTIYLQAPDGRVLHRQDDYDDGAEGLATAIGRVDALREPDPKYDPKKDPDRRKADDILPSGLPMPLIAAVGVGLVALVLLLKR